MDLYQQYRAKNHNHPTARGDNTTRGKKTGKNKKRRGQNCPRR
jgi:hypothetical protein